MSWNSIATEDDEPNASVLIGAMAAEHFRDADAARMRELDRLIAKGYGSTDPRDIPADELTSPAAAAPAPTQETTMPCAKCKRAGHNARSCPQTKTKPEAAPAREEARPRPPRGALSSIEAMSVPELLSLRGVIESEIKARLERLDAERKALLEAMKHDQDLLQAAG